MQYFLYRFRLVFPEHCIYPKNKKYYLSIISTNPKERYRITQALLRENKLSYILLEKFVFSNNYMIMPCLYDCCFQADGCECSKV